MEMVQFYNIIYIWDSMIGLEKLANKIYSYFLVLNLGSDKNGI
jgi:hypothetical protein